MVLSNAVIFLLPHAPFTWSHSVKQLHPHYSTVWHWTTNINNHFDLNKFPGCWVKKNLLVICQFKTNMRLKKLISYETIVCFKWVKCALIYRRHSDNKRYRMQLALVRAEINSINEKLMEIEILSFQITEKFTRMELKILRGSQKPLVDVVFLYSDIYRDKISLHQMLKTWSYMIRSKENIR